MVDSTSGEITKLLTQWRSGSQAALEALTPLVYSELRAIARRQISRERGTLTLGATELTHEAFIRLVGQRRVEWQNRAHFLALGAELMRRILVDHARKRQASKRGDGNRDISLTDTIAGNDSQDVEILSLHDVLSRLASLDARQARIVELRYFGGLTIEETSEVLHISPATIKREWEVAKLWLRRALGGETPM
jgi:RNA polymerase sigma factor (TIGR02999 family)